MITNKEKCCGCYACTNACPVHAIEMTMDEEGFFYPQADEQKCISCGKCVQVCPMQAKPENHSMMRFFGVKLKDKGERLKSSSGGAFYALAKLCLKKQGLVCGVAYDQQLSVRHMLAENEAELDRLRGTKYVQSSIGTVYADIRKALSLDRYVLFSGTPCQVAGLKNYLGREYEKLLCIDLICHGVPSPMIWNRYIREISAPQRVTAVNMRGKENGIRHITLDYCLEDGSCIKEEKSQSLYMKGFIQNLYVRPSCYDCPHKGLIRCSDITIGDFWADHEFYPEFADDCGTSSVMVHTHKGLGWMEQITNDAERIVIKKDELLCWNSSILESAIKNDRRPVFWERIRHRGIMEAIEECVVPVFPVPKPETPADRMKKLIKAGGMKLLRSLRG